MVETLIRLFRDEDAAATAQVIFDSIRVGARDHYDDAQRRAWIPEVPETDEWLARLKPHYVLIAERDRIVIGFMTLTADGLIDLAFVAPDAIGQGVAKALYDALLVEARSRGQTRLRVAASLLARPFFERQGWSVSEEETVIRSGVALRRFRMEIDLP